MRLFLEHELANISKVVRPVDVAVAVCGDTFRHARTAGVRVGTGIRNEVLHRANARAADSDSAPRAEIEGIAGGRQPAPANIRAAVARFRVGNVHRISAPVDENAAWAPELEP